MRVKLRNGFVAAMATGATLLSANAYGAEETPGSAELTPKRGSLRSMETLGEGNVGLSLGGGVAVLLPMYGFEIGYGITNWLDLAGRFETVIGVFHYPQIGARFQLLESGRFRFGASLNANYSFFGIQTDQTNFTSTFYFSPELGVSAAVTEDSELVAGVGAEIDVFEHRIVDDEGEVFATGRYDATIFRGGLVTSLTNDLNGYAQMRLRVPTETFVFEAQEFYVIPLIEIGGTWTF